jgi:hypothetical protein
MIPDSSGGYEPSSMYDGCLNVAICIRANLNREKSLSETPRRCCKRFFVSENRSPFNVIGVVNRGWSS